MNKEQYFATFQLQDGKHSYTAADNIDDCMSFLLRCINGNNGYKEASIKSMVGDKCISCLQGDFLMQINFEDNSYIEIKKSNEIGKVLIIVQAKDTENPKKNITNICEITVEQLKDLYLEVIKIEE